MSLSSALFSGLSGLSTLGNSLTVIGDNIANVNTVGFKPNRVTFQDVLSQNVATAAGTAQVGRGTALADISTNFAQGSFESTDSSTDLAIGGEGFFVVRDPNSSENEFYSRAGDFRFDKDGYFTTSGGYIARGWEVNTSGEAIGSVGDIALSSFTSSPVASTSISLMTNLSAESSSNVASLELVWDGDDPTYTYLAPANYDHQSTVKIYDSLGQTHDITVYYDMGAVANTWEYIVCCAPSEDERTDAAGDGQGLLARGTIEFNSSGSITEMTMSNFNGQDDMTSGWSACTLPNGYLTFEPSFVTGSTMSVAFNPGLRFNSTTLAWEAEALSSSQYAQPSSTVFQSADGYGSGGLETISVGIDGIITGNYSNGEVIPLYQVTLAKFQNQQGLYKCGGNLWRETRLSGDPVTGAPGTNGLGSIAANSLEQSNVDIASEFVKMITTQRGFQANSKIISVTDEMMAQLMSLKR
jgi:flagellar hook protein FlgE